MTIKKSRRALIVTGAGASLDFGVPGTGALTSQLATRVLNDKWSRRSGADRAYVEIRDKLAGYLLGGADAVNFEQVYHCAHELLFTFEPDPAAADEYRPILVPLIKRRLMANEQALQALVDQMAKFLFEEVSKACDRSTSSLSPLVEFIDRLHHDHVMRFYTTNYDDVLLRAAPDLHTGFAPTSGSDPSRFSPSVFWDSWDADGLFHLHGSVHMAFPHPIPPGADIGELCWFADRAKARSHASFKGSGHSRMDGTQVERTAVITGLDKLSRLQQTPFQHYYASLAQDAMAADIILVIGSGLVDRHLNTWLCEARRKVPPPPLVFLDYWPDGFLVSTSFETDRKTAEMFHALHMRVNIDSGAVDFGGGWTLDSARTCAVWDRGFLDFLRAPDELGRVLAELT